MVLPNARYRAQKKYSALAFDQVQSATATNANASVTMTTPAATLIIAASNNIITGMTVTVDGVAATLLGTQGDMRLYTANVAAGSHTIVGAASGAWRTLIVASYTGVSAVSGYAGASGTSVTPSITPSGSGTLAVAAFVGNNTSAAGTTSNGDLRAKQAAASAAYNLALADRTSAPVTLTQTSAAWSAVGVWLS